MRGSIPHPDGRPRLHGSVRLLAFGAAAGIALAVAGPSLAAEAPAAAERVIGLPQLRLNEPLVLAQIFWVLVLFGALYWILSRHALPPVQQVLADRAETIRVELDAARDAKASADQAVAELERAIEAARAEAQAKLRAATDKAKADAAAREVETSARLAERLREAEARIAATSRSARDDVLQAATAAAVQVVATVTGSTPSSERAAVLVADAAAKGAR